MSGNFSEFEQNMFNIFVKIALHVSRGTFWGHFFKRDHFHAELTNHLKKKRLHTEGTISFS